MMRVFISGATGFLGRHILQAAPPGLQLLTHSRTPFLSDYPGLPRHISMDLAAPNWQPVREFAPELIIHLAAMSSPDNCEQSPALAEQVNEHATAALAVLARELHARLIYVSTDLVFDGAHAPYCEIDIPQPLNHYGQTKLAGEKKILALYPANSLVARCPLLYGVPVGGGSNFTQVILQKLQRGETVALFADEFRTPAWAADVARAIWLMAGESFCGVMHLGGGERLSRYQMGEQLCAAFAYSCEYLRAIHTSEINTAAKRPADCSLDSSLATGQFGLLLPGFSARIADAFADDAKKSG